MKSGQIVDVKLYGGAIVKRRVVADKGDVVVICSEYDYALAMEEGREPDGLGFPRECVVDSKEAV